MSPTTFIAAHASHPDWRIALADSRRQLQSASAARAARYGAAAPLTLGWCYLTDYYAAAAEAILDELRQAFPGVAWIGTSGIGVAASGIEYFDEPAMVLMVAPLPRECFRLFSGRQPLPAAATGFAPHTALVHADGSTPDLQELLQELSARTATGYLFGGLSSARGRPLHMADGVFTGGVSGVAFDAEVDLVSRVTQGCQPIGPLREVTAAEGNLLISLDRRPALDCAMNDLGLDDDAADEDLFEALSATLVGLSRGAEDLPAHPGQFGAETVVRHLVGVDLERKVLGIADAVEPGMLTAFCMRDARAAGYDLVRIAAEIRDDLESGAARQMAGALYVSCSGRGGPHFGARHAELQMLRNALGDVPLAGFFAGGEIARNHLYGYTGVLTVFATPG
ncbi:MAG: FIST N-terminal domain-containing protein [Rhodocyclaceae bacterium]|nr:FIST N-terminal domain-containing protein [Rhodocyclaceae bacterium]